MVGCCHAAVAGDATSVPPVDSTTAGINTTKPGIAGVLAPLAGQTVSCTDYHFSAYFHVAANGDAYMAPVDDGKHRTIIPQWTRHVRKTGVFERGSNWGRLSYVIQITPTGGELTGTITEPGFGTAPASIYCFAQWQ
jgi:hypothetical protein